MFQIVSKKKDYVWEKISKEKINILHLYDYIFLGWLVVVRVKIIKSWFRRLLRIFFPTCKILSIGTLLNYQIC